MVISILFTLYEMMPCTFWICNVRWRAKRVVSQTWATILDKSVETIVENRITSRKLVVRVKFQAPSSPIQCWTKSSIQEQHCMGEGGVAEGFESLFTDISVEYMYIRVLWIFSRGFVPDCTEIILLAQLANNSLILKTTDMIVINLTNKPFLKRNSFCV